MFLPSALAAKMGSRVRRASGTPVERRCTSSGRSSASAVISCPFIRASDDVSDKICSSNDASSPWVSSGNTRFHLCAHKGTQSKTQYHVDWNDPLSAAADLSRTLTISRQADLHRNTVASVVDPRGVFVARKFARFRRRERSLPPRMA